MRHRKKLKAQFGSKDWGHVDSMMRNLLTSLCTHRALTTTAKRAIFLDRLFSRLVSRVQGAAEPRIAIREVMRHVTTEEASKALISEIVPAFADRKSGFLRSTPLSFRSGDGALLVKIELV